MSKLKNFKISFKHLLTAVSVVGLAAGFTVALFSKKKAAACAAFFVSFAGLIAGLGMEEGLIPEPKCCKKVEVDFDDWDDAFDDEDRWSDVFDDAEEDLAREDGEDESDEDASDDNGSAKDFED